MTPATRRTSPSSPREEVSCCRLLFLMCRSIPSHVCLAVDTDQVNNASILESKPDRKESRFTCFGVLHLARGLSDVLHVYVRSPFFIHRFDALAKEFQKIKLITEANMLSVKKKMEMPDDLHCVVRPCGIQQHHQRNDFALGVSSTIRSTRRPKTECLRHHQQIFWRNGWDHLHDVLSMCPDLIVSGLGNAVCGISFKTSGGMICTTSSSSSCEK